MDEGKGPKFQVYPKPQAAFCWPGEFVEKKGKQSFRTGNWGMEKTMETALNLRASGFWAAGILGLGFFGLRLGFRT